MSSDFGFWKKSSIDAEEAFDELAEGDASSLTADADVLRFRERLLANWSDIVSSLDPTASDLEEDTGIASKYVLLTLSVKQLDYLDEVLLAARENRLTGYSGVADEPI